MSEAPKKKSGVLKWVLIGCGSVMFLGIVAIALVVYMASQAIIMDPPAVEAKFKEILPMEIPAGMQGVFGMSMMGVEMAMLGADQNMSGGKGVMLMTFPGEVSEADMQRQMKENMEKQGRGQQGQQVEQKDVAFKVRGQEVKGTLTVYEQKNGDVAVRSVQYLIVLQEKNKPVMLMFMGGEAETTPEYVQANLDTIK